MLSTSIVFPLYAVKISPGLYAFAPLRFSVDGIIPTTFNLGFNETGFSRSSVDTRLVDNTGGETPAGLNLEYPDSYIDSMNNGLMKLDNSGKCRVSVNCPQPYKDKGISYMSHIHMLVSDKKMTRWNKGIYTQNVLCEINKKNLIHHMQRKDRLVINALSSDYHNKAHIPNSYNLFYKEAKTLGKNQIHNKVRRMIKEEPNIQKIIKKNKLKITEVPIIVYCYDKHCDAGHQLANELFKAGYTNVIDYLDGTLGYFGRKRY